jgi:glutathione synthase
VSGRSVAVIMDPIGSIKPSKDSTLAMLLAAQARGWRIHYGELRDIWLRDGEAFGRLTDLHVADDPTKWFDLGEATVTPLGDLDVILMRKDPPFDMEYIYATYILERAEAAGALVVNRPQSLRDANEKVFISWFPEVSAPALVSRSLPELRAFIEEHGRAVLKPLDLMAGRSVFLTAVQDPNRNALLETMTELGTRYVMAQRYVEDIVESGDARILMIDGKPPPTALVRIPPADDHRGNISAGAETLCRPLTQDELTVCDAVGPLLREKGLLFAGIDVIGGFMTEINVTSPTGIRELERDGGLQVTRSLLDAIETRIARDSRRTSLTK